MSRLADQLIDQYLTEKSGVEADIKRMVVSKPGLEKGQFALTPKAIKQLAAKNNVDVEDIYQYGEKEGNLWVFDSLATVARGIERA